MDTRERILRKIGSSPITNWILTKLLMVKRRRMHKLRGLFHSVFVGPPAESGRAG